MSKKKRIGFIVLFTAVWTLTPFVTSSHGYIYSAPLSSAQKAIALTFDDGPGEYTEKLLDGLKKENAKASFFLLGKQAEKHPETIERIYNDGHLIGNHTYSHTSLFETNTKNFIHDLKKSEDIIKNITGNDVLFFRPPHGFYTGRRLNKIDRIAIPWSNDPADWKNTNSDYVCSYLLDHAEDGKIFLLHDTKESTVDGVLKAIPLLKKQGFEFLRADELLCRNGNALRCGLAYRMCKKERKPLYF